MRDLLTSLPVAVVAALLFAGCSPSGRDAARPATTAAQAPASAADPAKADATRRAQELEAAITDARERIAAAEAKGTLTRQERLILSETRRAVVVANVSLQKARTALAAGDYAAASQAVDGAAARLRAVAEGKAVTSAQGPDASRK
jgi:hypothetical protein